MEIRSIAIVGTGVIGASWAAFYASKGLTVKLYDREADACQKGYHKAKEILNSMQKQELLSETNATEALSKVNTAIEFGEVVFDVELVQESVSESYTIKKDVFTKLDALTQPDVILASSSSGLLMSEIQKATRHPGRCVITHPFNPPHLIPLVEVAPGKMTHKSTTSRMQDFFERLGKVPVVLKKEVPGHIANRLAIALWREAVDLVLNGVASVEAVDKAVSAGPGLRWAIMGPHMIYHLGGGEGGMERFIEHLGPALEIWWEDMANWKALPPETKKVLSEGLKKEMGTRSLSDITMWRDATLTKLLKAIYE